MATKNMSFNQQNTHQKLLPNSESAPEILESVVEIFREWRYCQHRQPPACAGAHHLCTYEKTNCPHLVTVPKGKLCTWHHRAQKLLEIIPEEVFKVVQSEEED